MKTLTDEEVRNILREGQYGHLGLCEDGNAYVIPMSYGYAGDVLYFHGSHGLKTEYVEATDRACFSIDNVRSPEEWVSVLAFGRVTRVTEERERLAAMDALMERPDPPAWGAGEAKRSGDSKVAEEYYKLEIDEVTGRASLAEGVASSEDDLEVLGA